jgi:MYXO-CTERM domain-containing protein
MKNSSIITVLSLSVAAFAGSASANLITNGDFSTRTFAGWTSWGDSTNQSFTYLPTGARFGLNYTDSADASGGIYQILSTVVGQEYTISFVVGSDFTGRYNFTAGFNNEMLVNLKSDGYGYIPGQNYSFTTVATKVESDLRFGFMSDDGWVYLDNVSVTATPTPGAIALLGVAGLVTGRRRRA